MSYASFRLKSASYVTTRYILCQSFSNRDTKPCLTWDEHTPAKQKGREWKKLSVADLKPGDAFDVEFVCLLDDYFVFDFFQVEVYYSIGHGK